MSLFIRLARPAHPVGRAYYSFSSSKPGGGRHFVSTKPPKPVLQPGRTKVDNTTTTESSPPANPDGVIKAVASDEKSSSKPVETRTQSSSVYPLSPSVTASDRVPIHPTVSSKEYKLHHFFSLHRPLLLLNQPTSTIFEAVDPSAPLFTPSEGQFGDPQASFATIDNPPESSPDADADAARQLAHALVTNRVGGSIAWQQTLSRLGLGGDCTENVMNSAKEAAQEWVTVHADSTRRKKRKKMKKHKLKKRRRLTRRQNK